MLHRVIGLLRLQPERKRSPERQREVEEISRGLALYHFDSCPYCVRVLRTLKRLDLQIELRNARLPFYQQELSLLGGRYQTPCLRIEKSEDGQKAQWLYESADIIRYLEGRFPMS
jgi:glutathione S-transferase